MYIVVLRCQAKCFSVIKRFIDYGAVYMYVYDSIGSVGPVPQTVVAPLARDVARYIVIDISIFVDYKDDNLHIKITRSR